MAEGARGKTAITSYHGFLRFMHMLWCLKPLRPIQPAMKAFIQRVRWHSSLLYFDDIVVFLQNAEEHIYHLRYVLTFLYYAEMQLKLNTS